MAKTVVHTLDLKFQGRSHAIAAYAIPHAHGVALIESGPGSTLGALESGLKSLGYGLNNITHVLLTHIHLDHAGAAGALAQYGAQIFVHPVGAPHMLNPEKLIASATRIYGEKMDTLWGQFLPVPEAQLHTPAHGEVITVGNLHFTALHTPGHAEHHYAYLFEDLCFSGDVGGVRIPSFQYLRAPMPPPELHFAKWHESIATLRAAGFKRIAPTHFGIFDDPAWQLTALETALSDAERWLEHEMPANPDVDTLRAHFTQWMEAQALASGLSEEVVAAYTLANPLGMSADGLLRYWKKFRAQ